MSNFNSVSRPALVVIGPSASGKSTVVRELARRGVLHVHPTWTTRPRRADELDGEIEHRFVTEAVFDELDASGFFLGSVELPGLPYRYALPRPRLRPDGPIDTVMARAPFIERLATFLPDMVVYQIEDTPARAGLRLLQRGSTPAEIAARANAYEQEAAAGRAIARRVFVNDRGLDELVDAFECALQFDLGERRIEVGR